jgi:hypothetical protein
MSKPTNTLTLQSFSVIITLLAQFQWEGLTNVMTLIHHIKRNL